MKAFTLVELIVVVTILAILGTLAFISLQDYSEDMRNNPKSKTTVDNYPSLDYNERRCVEKCDEVFKHSSSSRNPCKEKCLFDDE